MEVTQTPVKTAMPTSSIPSPSPVKKEPQNLEEPVVLKIDGKENGAAPNVILSKDHRKVVMPISGSSLQRKPMSVPCATIPHITWIAW